jgi:hypothetical protein
MELPKNVTAEQFLEAVRQGVRDAFVDLLKNEPNGPNHLECALVVLADSFREAVIAGIENSMPWPTQILNALTDGVKEATTNMERVKWQTEKPPGNRAKVAKGKGEQNISTAALLPWTRIIV